MAKLEFEYTEIDGKFELDSLGIYGRLRLSYLHEQKPGISSHRQLAGHITLA